jgi:hypothetical protein
LSAEANYRLAHLSSQPIRRWNASSLITANQAFAAALKQALLKGAETSAGVLATVRPKRRKNGILPL